MGGLSAQEPQTYIQQLGPSGWALTQPQRSMPCLQVSEAVGEGQSAEACEELFRKQHAYLCIPKHMQSGQAFVAIVKNAQMEASAGPSPSSTSQGGSGGGGAGREPAGSGGAAGSMQGGEREAVEQGFGDERRSRRTPKRSDITSPGGRVSRALLVQPTCAQQLLAMNTCDGCVAMACMRRRPLPAHPLPNTASVGIALGAHLSCRPLADTRRCLVSSARVAALVEGQEGVQGKRSFMSSMERRLKP